MKILAILLSPPVPATAGHRVRNRSLLRALALEGHEVTAAMLASAEEIAHPARELKGLCHEFFMVESPEGSAWGRLAAVFGGKPYGALRLSVPELQQRVAAELAAHDFDFVLLDDIYMAGNLPAGNRVPVVLNKHDITCRIVRQFGRSERNPLKKLYAAMEAAKIERMEYANCRAAEAVAVCSECDGKVLSQIAPGAHSFVIPNVIDTDKYKPAPQHDGRTVVFVGAMDWLPNQDGADFLIVDILPRLRQLVPAVRVVLAGRNPPEWLRRRFAPYPDVSFTGTVVELRPILARASVCVVPLRIGSGTRLKILEASAMAKPVVSTVLGAEGLDLRHGQEILLVDEPRAFAEAVALLLNDRARANAMGAAARAAVEEQYSIPALRRQLQQMFAAVRERRAKAGSALA
ncbi:MAG: glycosyltransferase family 4 protein [Acidobacteriota bacterium]|nr:glycosyltransferase family 4 protein [Acidobacteriota bacterium]